MMVSLPASLSPETLAVAAGRPPREPGLALNAPITPATALIPGTGIDDYAREGHSGWEPIESIVGQLEGGHAVSFASGMAATAAVVEHIGRGGRVVVGPVAYSGTWSLLNERAARGDFQLDILTDITNTAEVIDAAMDASMVWLESPVNPTLEVADVEQICRQLADSDTYVVVDNTFATPLRQRPLALGADCVVHSASKLISGHSDTLMGIAVARDEANRQALAGIRTELGAVPGSLESYLATRGIRTLSVRLDRAEANAAELRNRLADHPQVTRVAYPGFGTMLAFEVAGGTQAADALTRNSHVITFATSLGGVESTWERRRRHSAEPTSVPEGLIRLSVGIEAVDDLWSDITQAFDDR